MSQLLEYRRDCKRLKILAIQSEFKRLAAQKAKLINQQELVDLKIKQLLLKTKR